MPFRRAYLLALLSPFTAQALDLHVSPQGNDDWSGRILTPNTDHSDGPLATLNGARLAIRKLPRPLKEPVHVIFAEGTYRQSAAIAFEAKDSGEEGKVISYEAASGAKVVLSGGKELPLFTLGKNGRWLLQTPAGTETFEQLWVADRRATRARTNNPGSHYVRSVESEAPIPGGTPTTGFTEQTIRVDPKELMAFSEISPADAQDAVVTFYHKWDSTRSRVETAQPATGTLKVRGPAQKANTAFDHLTGMVIENLLSLLDEPGEWFLSRSGQLTYLPRQGESIATSGATYPVAEKLLTFVGKPQTPVTHLAFRGLRFSHAKGVPSLATAVPNQSAVRTVDGVITLEHARQVSFTGCELSHVGSYGFSLRQGCREVSIEKCLITDLGAGGIKVKCGGRLGGAEIARVEGYHEGRVPLHTLRADIDYATSTAKTTIGTIGVKVWIFKGEVVEDRRGKTYSTDA